MSSAVISTTLSTAIASEDGFHHLVYSISGTTHTLFLDNSAIAVNISGGNVFTNYQTISNLFFGIAGDMSYGYTGYLDDVKVFNRALTVTDVSAIYNLKSIISSTPFTFTSNTFPGMTLWLDADTASTFTNTNPSSGGAVSWNDRSGNNRNAVNSSGCTIQMSTFNGKPSIYFPPSSQQLTISSLTLDTFPLTYFAVFNWQSTSNSSTNFLLSSNYPPYLNLQFYQQFTTNGYQFASGVTGGQANATLYSNVFSSTLLSTFTLLTLQLNSPNNYVLNINGSSSVGAGSNFSAYPSESSGKSTSAFIQSILGMYVSEMILYQGTTLTQPQYQQVEGYLSWKWGLNDKLPTTHPYYTTLSPTMPTDYLYYFKFRGDAVNYGSLSSSVPTASYAGTSPNPNGTIGGKTCLTIPTGGDYVFFPAFGSSPTTPPPSNFSFGFWCNMQNFCQTNSIADKTFGPGTIWQGDVYNGFATVVAANTQWRVQTGVIYNTYSTWVHILYTVQNATTFISYVNGVAVSTQTNGTGSFTSLSNYYMILGRAGDNSTRFFGNCGMREFVLYNRILSAAEVSAIYVLTA